MQRPIRGLLLGPLVVPVGYWIGIMAYACIRGACADPNAALRELRVIFLFGLPVTYIAVLAWGAPAVFLFRSFGGLKNPVPLMVAGAVGGALLALLIEFLQQVGLFKVRLPLAAGAALGALAAASCWWQGQGRPAPVEAP